MIMISERPAEVEDRAIPGHWEGDLITGAGNQSAIGTLVERATRYTLLVHPPDGHDAEHVRDQLVATIVIRAGQASRGWSWSCVPDLPPAAVCSRPFHPGRTHGTRPGRWTSCVPCGGLAGQTTFAVVEDDVPNRPQTGRPRRPRHHV